ncbi:MAG: T9SS type A sorting domain-containing protein [Bacteroidota bacterium]|nr:T9SS type A sorting domain-containing protein [Bacteroidota bacterium]
MNFFKIILINLFVFSFANTSYTQETIERVKDSPFPFSSTPDTLFVIYEDNFSDEEILIIQTLQGILAKEKPKIFRDVGTGSTFWLNDLEENHNVFLDYSVGNNFEYLLSLFISDIDSYIKCKLHSSSSNLAISLSGIYNSIPVTDVHLSLMDSLAIPMKYDATNLSNDWFFKNYSDSISKEIVVYQNENKDLCLGDYSVFSKAYHFYDDIHSDLVDSVFSNMNSNSVLLGWGDDEYQTVHKSSRFSINVLPSDYAYNLSVLTNFNQEIQQKSHEITTETRENTHTVCFVMSDGDNIQWLLNWFYTDQRWFGSLNRGQVDIGWTISPSLSELAPTVLNKIYSSASDNINAKDYFIAGPSGYSYIYPNDYVELEEYTEILNNYMLKSDLGIVNIIASDNNDFYLYPYLNKPSVDAIFYYDFSNYSKHKGDIKFLNNKPIISARYNLWGGFENTVSLANKINNLPKDIFSENGYSLIPVHNWSNSVDSIIKCVNLLDSNVRVVSPDKFINIINENLIYDKLEDEIIHLCYPNPISDKLTLELRIGVNQIEKVSLFSINGQKVNDIPFTILESEEKSKIEFDFTSFNSGSYLLKVYTKNNSLVKKLIIN